MWLLVFPSCNHYSQYPMPTYFLSLSCLSFSLFLFLHLAINFHSCMTPPHQDFILAFDWNGNPNPTVSVETSYHNPCLFSFPPLGAILFAWIIGWFKSTTNHKILRNFPLVNMFTKFKSCLDFYASIYWAHGFGLIIEPKNYFLTLWTHQLLLRGR